MRNALAHTLERLRRMSPLVRFCALFAAIMAINLFWTVLSAIVPALELGDGPVDFLREIGGQHSLVLGVFIAPAIETAVFQALPLHVANRIRWIGQGTAILISVLAFGAVHPYSLGYVLYAACVGLVLAVGYVAQMRPGGLPFYLVFLVHAATNFTAWLDLMFFDE